MRVLYVVLMLKDYNNYKIEHLNFTVKQHPEMGKYFLPVFDSDEEARKHYPNAQIQKISVQS